MRFSRWAHPKTDGGNSQAVQKEKLFAPFATGRTSPGGYQSVRPGTVFLLARTIVHSTIHGTRATRRFPLAEHAGPATKSTAPAGRGAGFLERFRAHRFGALFDDNSGAEFV